MPSPTWRGVVEEEPRPTVWDGARRALTSEGNHAKSTSARVLRGRLAGFPWGEARAGCVPWGSNELLRRTEAAAADLARCWRRRASAYGVGWSASRVGRKDNNAKSARKCVLRGWLAGSLRREARAGRARRGSKAMATTSRSRSRRPGEGSAKKSLGQRRGASRVARWPRRQPRQVRQQARALCADGRFSTRRSDRRSRGTGVNYSEHETTKPPSPAWRRVVQEAPRPTLWDGAHRALTREDNHAKSASKRALRGPSVGSPRSEATVGRTARESTTVTMRFRSRRRRAGEVSAKKGLGQRYGAERVAR